VIFGQCDDASVAVVKAIARVERNSDDKPLTPVVLQKVTIVPEGAPMPPAPGTAPAQGELPKRINISAGVAVGLLTSKVQPAYPIDAKRAGVSGRVELEAVIGTDGAIKDLQVVAGPDLLQQAALDAVRQWRYRPYLLNGQPVEVHTIINVVFTLGG
jgi:TonB family protein